VSSSELPAASLMYTRSDTNPACPGVADVEHVSAAERPNPGHVPGVANHGLEFRDVLCGRRVGSRTRFALAGERRTGRLVKNAVKNAFGKAADEPVQGGRRCYLLVVHASPRSPERRRRSQFRVLVAALVVVVVVLAAIFIGRAAWGPGGP